MKAGEETCSRAEIDLVATLFQKYSNSVPDEGPECYLAVDGQTSCGFYFLFLKLTTYEANAKAFFQILEIDWQIGWSNPAHVEANVFEFKAIQIIEDEQVSGKI